MRLSHSIIIMRGTRASVLERRKFVCCREGERDGKSHGVWYVNNFVDEHNHRLAMPDEVPMVSPKD